MPELSCKQVCPKAEADTIRDFRRKTLEAVGYLPLINIACEPLEYASYFYLFDGNHRIGMAEGFPYHEAGTGLHDFPQSSIPALWELAPFHELAHIRTIYLDPGYQKRTSCFGAFTMYLVMHGLMRGMRFATISTTMERVSLYQKIGATVLGEYALPCEPPISPILCVLDLQAVATSKLGRKLLNQINYSEN